MSLIKSVAASVSEHKVLYERLELQATFLPAGEMLQLDRVLEISGPSIVCEMDLMNHWAFHLHFPHDPIFPGSLLMEACGQTAAVWAWHAGLRGKPRLLRVRARFDHPVLPQDRVVTFHASMRQRKKICLGRIEALVQDRKVAQADISLMVVPGQAP